MILLVEISLKTSRIADGRILHLDIPAWSRDPRHSAVYQSTLSHTTPTSQVRPIQVQKTLQRPPCAGRPSRWGLISVRRSVRRRKNRSGEVTSGDGSSEWRKPATGEHPQDCARGGGCGCGHSTEFEGPEGVDWEYERYSAPLSLLDGSVCAHILLQLGTADSNIDRADSTVKKMVRQCVYSVFSRLSPFPNHSVCLSFRMYKQRVMLSAIAVFFIALIITILYFKLVRRHWLALLLLLSL